MTGTIQIRSTRTAPVSERLVGLVCPYCKDSLDGQGAFVECAACTTWFHEECFLENRGCMTMGCDEQRSNRPVVRRVRPPPTRRRRSIAPPAPSATPVAPRGIGRLDVMLACFHAAGLAPVATFAAVVSLRLRDPKLLEIDLAAFLLVLFVELALGAHRPKRTHLSGGQKALCVLCGLAAGLVGVPLLLFGATR